MTKTFLLMHERQPDWLKGVMSSEEIENDARRLGFCPVMPFALRAPACSPTYTEEREEVLDEFYSRVFGPDLPSPGHIDGDPDWPDTVLHARDVVSRWLNVEATLERTSDLTMARKVWGEITSLAPLDATPEPIKSQIQDLSKRLWNTAWAENVTISLLQRFPADLLPLSKTSLAVASLKSASPEQSWHCLLGHPVSQEASEKALGCFQELGWIEPGAAVSDVTLLLRLSSDTAIAGNFGDDDALHFFVSRTDFERRRFDRAISVISGN